MLSLPPIVLSCVEGESRVVLPCPAVDLMRLFSWKIGQQSLPRLTEQIADNPSLLVFCAVEFHAAFQSPAQSLVELAEWFGDHLDFFFPRLLHHLSHPTHFGATDCPFRISSEFRKRLKSFLYIRNGKKSSKELRKFLTETTCVSQRMASQSIEASLGFLRNLNAERGCLFKDSDHSFRDCKKIFRRWTDDPFSIDELKLLLTLHQNLKRNEQEFQQQLLTAKLASLKQLAYGASHEINNPLANIATRAQSLLAAETDIEKRLKLSIIYEQAIRSHEMIADLMLFANPPAIHWETVDLPNFLTRLNNRFQVRSCVNNGHPRNDHASGSLLKPATGTSAGTIPFIIRLAPGLTTVDCDQTQLMVALQAIVRNSIESILVSPGTTIELRVSIESQSVCFSISDDGNGVHESIQPHLFDPFFSGREAGRGLGFGLSKAWRIAELHGGNLEFDPRHKPGARFILRIPLSRNQVSHD